MNLTKFFSILPSLIERLSLLHIMSTIEGKTTGKELSFSFHYPCTQDATFIFSTVSIGTGPDRSWRCVLCLHGAKEQNCLDTCFFWHSSGVVRFENLENSRKYRSIAFCLLLLVGIALNSIESAKAKAGVAHVAVIITLLGALAGWVVYFPVLYSFRITVLSSLGMGAPSMTSDPTNPAAVEKVLMGCISLYHVVESVKYFRKRKAERLAKEAAEKGK